MHRQFTTALLACFALSTAAYAGDNDKKTVAPAAPEEDHWKFLLASPGWMAGVEGTVGINGVNSDIDLGFHDIFNKIDMAWATSVEASKGRFGIMGELIYLSMSDSLGIGGPVRKIDVRVDEYLADFSLRWRLIESERGFVDALVGVRYTNMYQHLHLQSDSAGISETSENIVDKVSSLVRDRLFELLSDEDFRRQLRAQIASVGANLDEHLGGNPRRQAVPNGPLAAGLTRHVELLIENIVREEEARLRAEINALQVQAAAREASVQQRVAAAKRNVEKRISKVLEKQLNRSFSRGDDWWDPYIGVRARYNFTPAIYVIGRADIGGFGVGSDLMWQAEAALGFQVTRSVFAEIGYRALSFDYDKGGLTDDTITHGAQITVGREF